MRSDFSSGTYQQALADVVDWGTARYDDGTVLMHT